MQLDIGASVSAVSETELERARELIWTDRKSRRSVRSRRLKVQ
jgi:hypothetical protein